MQFRCSALSFLAVTAFSAIAQADCVCLMAPMYPDPSGAGWYHYAIVYSNSCAYRYPTGVVHSPPTSGQSCSGGSGCGTCLGGGSAMTEPTGAGIYRTVSTVSQQAADYSCSGGLPTLNDLFPDGQYKQYLKDHTPNNVAGGDLYDQFKFRKARSSENKQIALKIPVGDGFVYAAVKRMEYQAQGKPVGTGFGGIQVQTPTAGDFQKWTILVVDAKDVCRPAGTGGMLQVTWTPDTNPQAAFVRLNAEHMPDLSGIGECTAVVLE
ncbi:MAG: hypothetical protein KDA89_09995 [Planctomycetaceae bacterium]|nr:hypothetical protein [Planctomycetaceae bacterium]